MKEKLFPHNFRPFEKATVVNFQTLSSGVKLPKRQSEPPSVI